MKHIGATLGVLLLSMPAACGSDQGLATTAGSSVLVPAVSQVVFRSLGGGYGPETAPPGAACMLGVATYTLALPSGMLTFDRCQVTDFTVASSYVPDGGQRVLTPVELGTARAALAAVKVSGQRTCGFDKGQLELEVDSPTESLTYGDDFYGCSTVYQQFVESDTLDNLGAVLDTLASG